MLAELLDTLTPGLPGGPAARTGGRPGREPAGLRDLLEGAAAAAAEVGGWTPDEPLRLWKSRVHWLLHCPRRAVTADEPSPGNLDDIVVGVLVDAAAKLLTLGAVRPVTAQAALAFLVAQADDRVPGHLADVGDDAAAALLAEAGSRIDRLSGLWPELEPGWWPRVEEPVRVPLAGGSVVLGGKLDILLGGPPTDRPAVVVEVKSGRWRDEVRSDAHLYGLLVTLRDGEVPDSVVTLAALEGQTQVEPIRPAVVHHVAERVAAVLEQAAGLAAGEVPEARGGSHCVTCPLRGTCPASRWAGTSPAPGSAGPGGSEAEVAA